MLKADSSFKQFYSETEAALMLGISLARLHALLDEHVFNDGSERPDGLQLKPSDLVLLRFWHRNMQDSKVIRMPRRPVG
jgi:hypothetical protein